MSSDSEAPEAPHTIDGQNLVAVNPETERFFAAAYRRIQALIVGLGVIASIPVFAYFGWRVGAGFLLGAALAFINFLWMKQSIIALTNRITPQVEDQKVPSQGRAVIFKFIFRYALIGAAAYVIIFSSTVSVYGALAGFFLSVVALLIEAVNEAVYAIRHND
jgi:hypothetical protein